MLRLLDDLRGTTLRGTDRDLGKVRDVLFDDRTCQVRYLVADTGGWLTGRKVLVSPEAAGTPDAEAGVLPVALSGEQIEAAPGLQEDLPVSKQHERDLASYYGWAPYWTGPITTTGAVPVPIERTPEVAEDEPAGDAHLRSGREVTGYHIQSEDAEQVGHVEDFIVETDLWTIRYLVVDTRDWLPGRKVLIAPTWAERVDWHGKEVYLDLTGKQIRGSPEFDPSAPVNREYEVRLYDYHGRPAYWATVGEKE